MTAPLDRDALLGWLRERVTHDVSKNPPCDVWKRAIGEIESGRFDAPPPASQVPAMETYSFAEAAKRSAGSKAVWRCTVCSCLWRCWPDGHWSMLNAQQTCAACCDNASNPPLAFVGTIPAREEPRAGDYSWIDSHACMTGDCAHNLERECALELRKIIQETAEHLRSLRPAPSVSVAALRRFIDEHSFMMGHGGMAVYQGVLLDFCAAAEKGAGRG